MRDNAGKERPPRPELPEIKREPKHINRKIKRRRPKVSAFSAIAKMEGKLLLLFSSAGLLFHIIGKLMYYNFAVSIVHRPGFMEWDGFDGFAELPGDYVAYAYIAKLIIVFGLLFLAVVSVYLLYRMHKRLVAVRITPPMGSSVGILLVVAGYLCFFQYHIFNICSDLASGQQIQISGLIKLLASGHTVFLILGNLGFLVAAFLIHSSISNTALQLRLPHPSGMSWTRKSAYFALAAGMFNFIALPVFYSGTFVRGGRELFFWFLILSEIVMVVAATLISLFAFVGVYSIPKNRNQ